MALAKVHSAAVLGVEAYALEVEVDVRRSGFGQFHMVGLPDEAVRESRERVSAALKNAGFDYPQGKITVNLAPADIRKEGSALDLPVALGLLASTEASARCVMSWCKADAPTRSYITNNSRQIIGDLYNPGHGRRVQIRNTSRQILGYIEGDGTITNTRRQKVLSVQPFGLAVD